MVFIALKVVLCPLPGAIKRRLVIHPDSPKHGVALPFRRSDIILALVETAKGLRLEIVVFILMPEGLQHVSLGKFRRTGIEDISYVKDYKE
jgi:hypothetical protein